MRYAMIMAGGSGTRLWPMSTAGTPKQLIPFIGGRSLLQIAFDRLEGLVPSERRFVCAGQMHRQAIEASLPLLGKGQYLGEPVGRDTVNAVGLAAAVIGKADPDAVIAVFTADHIIEPVDRFREIVQQAYAIVDKHENALVTFGITPTHAATGFGYLQLGDAFDGGASVVSEFREKPPADVAQQYFAAGPAKYLWNSGMFVWRAATLLDCLGRYRPAIRSGLMKIADAWGTSRQQATLEEVYPTLEKTSVDYAVMEPAAKDAKVRVVAVPMPLTWLDVGSWPAFAQVCRRDDAGNAYGDGRHFLLDTRTTLVASSDPSHVIATIGCDDLIIIHTPDATLVCRKDKAELVKKLQDDVARGKE